MNIKEFLKEFFNLTYYTSQLDQFLSDFNQKHPKLSASQRAEKNKYDRIFEQRDQPSQPTPKKNLWDQF